MVTKLPIHVEKKIDEIKADQLSGSTAILDLLISVTQQFFRLSPPGPVIDRFLEAVDPIRSIHSEMIVLHQFIDWIRQHLGSTQQPELVLSLLQEYRKKWENIYPQIANNLTAEVFMKGKNVLLHSHSETIVKVLRELQPKVKISTIYQTESRPGYEGKIQGKRLNDLGYNVKLLVDFAIHSIADNIDLILLGADSYDPDCFVNKIGSFSICQMANHHRKPVYVISDTRKMVSRVTQPIIKPSSDIPDNLRGPLPYLNPIFEVTNFKFTSALITETHILHY